VQITQDRDSPIFRFFPQFLRENDIKLQLQLQLQEMQTPTNLIPLAGGSSGP
jgi:hypothetical protein